MYFFLLVMCSAFVLTSISFNDNVQNRVLEYYVYIMSAGYFLETILALVSVYHFTYIMYTSFNLRVIENARTSLC